MVGARIVDIVLSLVPVTPHTHKPFLTPSLKKTSIRITTRINHVLDSRAFRRVLIICSFVSVSSCKNRHIHGHMEMLRPLNERAAPSLPVRLWGAENMTQHWFFSCNADPWRGNAPLMHLPMIGARLLDSISMYASDNRSSERKVSPCHVS